MDHIRCGDGIWTMFICASAGFHYLWCVMQIGQKIIAATFGIAISLVSMSAALSYEKVFAPGQLNNTSELPPGEFRSALESLPPTARGSLLGIW
jgi:hypothetical protein